ncbi:MAG: Holliday junction branch migration protein RuvA [Vicinamibacteria bacterium]|nr:Holliday junction branch migration protein RuvA [Vicinamibacteria bacterium]
MIGHLQGELISKLPHEILIDVAGVGYRVLIPLSTYYRLGEPRSRVALFIHTHVREDALLLFGFGTTDEKSLFERLISVSGVGPKLAINILSGIEAPDLTSALRTGDVAALTRIPGVGKRTAERLILELRHKMPTLAEEPRRSPVASGAARDDLLSVLGHLGYSPAEAERAVDRALRESPEQRFEDLLRHTLQILSCRR